MADLNIPREAVEAAARQIHTRFDDAAPIEQHNAREAAMAALNAAAPLIVAAELERIADNLRANVNANRDVELGISAARGLLRARAEQLRAQT